MSGNAGYDGHDGWTYCWGWTGNANNVSYSQANAPATGQVVSISVYVDGYDSNCRLAGCLWNSSGTLLVATPVITVGQKNSFSPGGQHWHTINLSSPFNITSGQVLFVGWWSHPSDSRCWSNDSRMGGQYLNSTSATSPANVPVPGNIPADPGNGIIGAYYTYQSGGIKSWSGSAWTKHPVKTWSGSAWIWRPLRTWTGSSWIRRG